MKRTFIYTVIAFCFTSLGALLAFNIYDINEDEKVIGYKVKIYNHKGVFYGISTLKILDDSTFVHRDGFTVDMDGKGESGAYGVEKRIIIPEKDRNDDFISDNFRWKKEGEWVYFDKERDVDSIVHYGDYAGMEYRVNTGKSEDGSYWYIDSLVIMKYKDKEVIFKK